MTNHTISRSYSRNRLLPLIMAIMLGVSVLAAGHAQSPTLHGAAHDTRHATGFPCH